MALHISNNISLSWPFSGHFGVAQKARSLPNALCRSLKFPIPWILSLSLLLCLLNFHRSIFCLLYYWWLLISSFAQKRITSKWKIGKRLTKKETKSKGSFFTLRYHLYGLNVVHNAHTDRKSVGRQWERMGEERERDGILMSSIGKTGTRMSLLTQITNAILK